MTTYKIGFEISASGHVLAISVSVTGWCSTLPRRFDLQGYRELFGEPPERIEATLLAYTDMDEEYVAPAWLAMRPALVAELRATRDLLSEAVGTLQRLEEFRTKDLANYGMLPSPQELLSRAVPFLVKRGFDVDAA
jgi:hypothetical protein